VEGLSAKTIMGWRSAYSRLRAYLRLSSEERFLRGDLEIQIQTLLNWIGWLRENGANHTTVNTYWRALHALFVRIARADAAADPTSYIAAPRPGRPAPRFLPRQALEDVFGFVRNHQWHGGEFEQRRNVAVLATMALGGCRLGEVLRLEVSDVRINESAILIQKTKGMHGGKHRTVYMAPALVAAMAEYLSVRKKRQLSTRSLFVAVRKDRGMAHIAIRRLCAFVTARTGVKIAPHMLRHTCATLLRQAGIADRLAMEQLGHSSLLALQRYSHVVNGELRREIAKVQIDFGE
jgi:site-specific recombinase XerD